MKRLTKTLLVAGLVLATGSLVQAKYGGGQGTEAVPYLIYEPNQMNEIGLHEEDWDKHFKLMADIDLGQFDGKDGREEFNVIAPDADDATWEFDGTPFAGVFDGNDRTISNFTRNSTATDYIGIFGCVQGEGAEIRNLVMSNIDVAGYARVGSLVGRMQRGRISNCRVDGGTVSGIWGYVGGMVADNRGTIEDCSCSVRVVGRYYVGGLAGGNEGTISNCYAGGEVFGTYEDGIGGLVGANLSTGRIENCHAAGSVSGDNNVGGLAGKNRSNPFDSGVIENSSSSSFVSGDSDTGGLVGKNNAIVQGCFAAGDVSGVYNIGGLVGCNGDLHIMRPSRGVIKDCYAIGDVTGDHYVGGLAGRQVGDDDGNRCYIIKCYSTGDVTGTGDNVGGLAGENDQSTISNSYSLSGVTGGNMVGGLLGRNYGDMNSRSYVTKCYSAGCVAGTTYVGGLVGWNYWNGPTDSFWDVNSSGQETSDGGSGVVGKTTAEMQQQSTFFDWDFTNTWDICENQSYPRLQWQIPVADLACPYGVTMIDFSVLAQAWQSTPVDDHWNPNCNLHVDDRIDLFDLSIFCEQWLEETVP